MIRWTRKDARIYDFSLCKVCGAAGGCGRDGCSTMTCLWCGTPQCSANGLGRGQCAVCYYGLLPGWSGSGAGQSCAYKGCTESAVIGSAPRKKGKVCATHAARILGTDYVEKRLVERDRLWHPVEVAR